MANKSKLKGVRKNRGKSPRNRAKQKKSVEEKRCLRLKLKK